MSEIEKFSILKLIREKLKKISNMLSLMFNPALYTEIKEKIENIEEALDEIEEYAKMTKEDNKELQALLNSVVGKLENLTEKTEDIVNENGENLERLSDKYDSFKRTSDYLTNICKEIEAGVSGFINSKAIDFLLEEFNREELKNGTYYSSPEGVYAIIGDKMFEISFDSECGYFGLNSINELPKDLSMLTEIVGYGEVLSGNLYDVKDKQLKQTLFMKSIVNRIQSSNYEKITELKNYQNIINTLLNDSVSVKEKDVFIKGNKNKLILSTKDETVSLVYDEKTNKIQARKGNEVLAIWKNEGKKSVEKIHFKKNEVDYEKYFDNDYVYAFFETHGLERAIMKERIKTAGEVGLANLFPMPKNIESFNKSYELMSKYTKCEKVRIKDDNGLFVKVHFNNSSLKGRPVYVSFDVNGNPNCYFIKNQNGSFERAENNPEVKKLRDYVNISKTKEREEYEKN